MSKEAEWFANAHSEGHGSIINVTSYGKVLKDFSRYCNPENLSGTVQAWQLIH